LRCLLISFLFLNICPGQKLHSKTIT